MEDLKRHSFELKVQSKLRNRQGKFYTGQSLAHNYHKKLLVVPK